MIHASLTEFMLFWSKTVPVNLWKKLRARPVNICVINSLVSSD